MKKTILIILAVLPIVLLVVIAFAGQILALYQYISVEKVEFVDRLNNVYDSETTFTVEQGKSKETIINIYPKLSTNQNVTYTSQDESVCTVDENGVITGVHWGYTTVTVKTEDGGRTAILNVEVTAKVPFAVYLSEETLSLKVGQSHILEAEVDAPVAVNKSVKYSSDDPSVVTVDANGKLVARSEGTATITATTVSGEKTDTCVVEVVEGTLPIYFDLENYPGVEKNSEDIYVCTQNAIDLRSVLKTEEGIDPDSVVIKITSGMMAGSGENAAVRATLEDGVLTLYLEGLVTVKAFVGDENSPTHQIEYKFGLAASN